MGRGSLRSSRQKMWLTWTVSGLAFLLFLFTAENLWVDSWLRHKFHRIPSLVPEAPSGAWFLVFSMSGVALALLIVFQILLLRNRDIHLGTKIGTGVAVLLVLLLSVQWLLVTNRQPGLLPLQASGRSHRVRLTWEASRSKVAGYNVYRISTNGSNYLKINSSPVQGLTYTDDTVESGLTYRYVIRATDALGNESSNSPEFTVTIP
jgi:hypothetical protein